MNHLIERIEVDATHGSWTCEIRFYEGKTYEFNVWLQDGWSEIWVADPCKEFSDGECEQYLQGQTFVDRTRKTVVEGQEIFLSKIFKWLTAQGV